MTDTRSGQDRTEPQWPVALRPLRLPSGVLAGSGRYWTIAGLAPLWRRHRLFIIVAAVSFVPRVLASLAFRPALFMPDTFNYLSEGVRLRPGTWHPAGYSIMLRLLEPFHSLLLVTTVQHLLGIGMAVIVYAVLRHWGVPAWGSVLATVPTLFDSRQIMLESLIAADTLYAFLVVAAVAIMLTKRTPAWWQCTAAAMLIAWCSLVRGNGPALIVPVLAFLLVRRVGWRVLTVGILSFAVPLAAYMMWFQDHHGTFATTSSDGFFLWSRTMSFANCAVIKPPPELRRLCPDRQHLHPTAAPPAWSVSFLSTERTPPQYLWNGRAWWRHDAHPGFNAANNTLAMRFALDAIRAQPGAYARTVGKEVALTFLATDRTLTMRSLHFTTDLWVPGLGRNERSVLRAYAHTPSNTHAVQPYAYFLFLYQLPVYFPGVAFLLVLAGGLAGVIRRWRQWGGPGVLPWAVAAIGIVLPPALHDYGYRYAIAAVPMACMAAGLAFTRRPTDDTTTSSAHHSDSEALHREILGTE